jgi:hypothetical protein
MQFIYGDEISKLAIKAIDLIKPQKLNVTSLKLEHINNYESKLNTTEIDEGFLYNVPIEEIVFEYVLSEHEFGYWDINKTYKLTGRHFNYLLSKTYEGKGLEFYMILPKLLSEYQQGTFPFKVAATWIKLNEFNEYDYCYENWKDPKRLIEELFNGWKANQDSRHVSIMRESIDNSSIYNKLM